MTGGKLWSPAANTSRAGLIFPRPGISRRATPEALEGRLVGVVAAAVGRPRIGVLTRAALAARRPAAARTALAAAGPALAAAGPALAAAVSVRPGHLVDLGRGVPQARADVVDLDLVHGPLLALLGLIRALPQPPGHDHPHPPGQRLGHVLRRLPPYIARQEQRITVLPLTRRVVPEPRRGRHPEPRHRLPRRGEPELRVIHEIPRDRDRGVACCHEQTSLLTSFAPSDIVYEATDISGGVVPGRS